MKTSQSTRLGDLLRERGLLSESQIQSAVALQQQSGKPLGQVLVDMRLLSQRQLDRTLKQQSLLRNALLTAVLSATPLQCCLADGFDAEFGGTIESPAAETMISLGTTKKVLTFALEMVGVLEASEDQMQSAYRQPVSYDVSVSDDQVALQLKLSF